MVTVNTKNGFLVNGQLVSSSDVRCLSRDAKPTTGIQNGTPLIEIDTGKKFLFDAESSTWKEIDSSVVITPASGVEF